MLEQFARDDGGRLQVVGVNYQDLPSDTRRLRAPARRHVPGAARRPERARSPQRYGVRGIPQTVFVDARGVVRGRVYGETSREALAARDRRPPRRPRRPPHLTPPELASRSGC